MRHDLPRKTPSIGLRLTVLNIATVLVAMVLVAVVVMWQLSSTFQAEHGRFFADKIAELQTDFAQGRVTAVVAEIARETGERETRQYAARVLASDGRVLGATPGMATTLPATAFPAITAARDTARSYAAGQRIFALVTVPLHAATDTTPLKLQIALDITSDHRLLMALRHAMWLTFAGLTVLLVLAGYAVSKHSLAPLQRIAGAARAVTPAHLAARIPTDPPWPRELAELVEVFNAMLTRLEEAFTRLARFSSDLAHELRTPLSNMSGTVEVCLLRERAGSEYRAVLESNLEECRRLAALVENLLFMARVEHAEAAVRIETFDGAEAAAWVAAQQAPAAATRGLAIEVSGNAAVTADSVLFRQALTNLLSNAIVHSEAHGAIRIELQYDDNTSCVRVIDQGIGIDAQHVPHLFDRFYRADPARSHENGQGTGLGLAIVKSIVDLHGGSVEVQSQPGAGTCVALRFPNQATQCRDRPTAQTA